VAELRKLGLDACRGRRRRHRGGVAREQRAVRRVGLEHFAKAQAHRGCEALRILLLGHAHRLPRLGLQRNLIVTRSEQEQKLRHPTLRAHEIHGFDEARRAPEVGVASRDGGVKVGTVHPLGQRRQELLELARKVEAQPVVQSTQRARHARVLKGGVQRAHLRLEARARRRRWARFEHARL